MVYLCCVDLASLTAVTQARVVETGGEVLNAGQISDSSSEDSQIIHAVAHRQCACCSILHQLHLDN